MSASPGTAWQPAHPLSTTLTPVVGREADLDGVLALIDDRACRLVTLTGPGGVGKTRLALYIAATLIEEFERDVVYVPLAALREPDLVLPAIGQALDPTFDGSEGHEERLVESLRARPNLLLVLDNFEQLLDAATHVARLLAQCADTTILITSQAALRIPGEHLYPLRPLSTPPAELTEVEEIQRSEAVTLFLNRAQAVKPDFALTEGNAAAIAEICRRLDGLPLAIELAAARTNILSPEALLARLSNRLQVLGGERRGVPDRLRTMRHAVAWSYDLLTPAEQGLFRALSVFAGGFPLDAVEARYEESDDGRDAWAVIGTLVDHSLVQVAPAPGGNARYQMLETLREYGLEQLDAQGETDAARLAHAQWMATFAEAAEPYLLGQGRETWLNRLEPEWENVRAAMTWALETGHEEIVLRTLSAIQDFCIARGHVSEAREFLDRALNALAGGRSVAYCRGLLAAGVLNREQRQTELARAHYAEARDLAMTLGERRLECLALIGLGYVAHDRAEYVLAAEWHGHAVDIAREMDDQRSLATALGNLGSVAYFQGHDLDAQRYWEEASDIYRSVGDAVTEAAVLGNLGAVAVDQGDYDRAERLQNRALQLHRALGSAPNTCYALINLAEISRHLGDHTHANDLLAEAIAMLREIGYTYAEGVAFINLADVALAQADLPRAASALLQSRQLFYDVGDQNGIVENVDLMARICAARGDHGLAVEFMAAAAALRERLGAVPKPVKRTELETLERSLREVLGRRDHDRHWQAGKSFDFETLNRRIAIVARQVAGPQRPQPTVTEPTVPSVEHTLTRRELEVVRLLAEGRSTRDIADALFISPRTATTHINNIFGKLEVSSRAAVVAHAMRAGLV